MQAFVWLGRDRKDRFGTRWPEPGEDWIDQASSVQARDLLIGGIADELWQVEFDGTPALVTSGLAGPARLTSPVDKWSSNITGELRLRLFEGARATLARTIVSVESDRWPNVLTRELMLDLVRLGKKVAAARTPGELQKAIDSVRSLVPDLWPPAKKRGLFSGKLDATRVYELLRKALDTSLAAAADIAAAFATSDLVASLNAEISGTSRLAKGNLMFLEMLRASAAAKQTELDAIVEEARAQVRVLREVENASAQGPAGLSGGFSFTATDKAPPDAATIRDEGSIDPRELVLPDSLRAETDLVLERLGIDASAPAVELAPKPLPVAVEFAHSADESTTSADAAQRAPDSDEPLFELVSERTEDPTGETDREVQASPSLNTLAARAAGHAHSGETPSYEALIRHVEEAHGQKAGLFGEQALRRLHDDAHAAPDDPIVEEAAAAIVPEAGEEPAPEPSREPKPEQERKPEPGHDPKPEPEPEPSGEPPVFVIPNSPAGIERAGPGPTEPSAPERAAAASASTKSTSPGGRSFPAPIAPHTHDEPISGHDALNRHVEVIHGLPVGRMEPGALRDLHDATHAND